MYTKVTLYEFVIIIYNNKYLFIQIPIKQREYLFIGVITINRHSIKILGRQ